MKLILMCGIPGSGKSTISKKLAELPNTRILSSDALRAVFGAGEHDQSVSARVFDFIHSETERFLKEGKTVIIDATNVSKRSRRRNLEVARRMGVPTKAVVVTVPLEVAKKRNSARARVVPDEVIERMYREFETPLTGEFDEVEIISNL